MKQMVLSEYNLRAIAAEFAHSLSEDLAHEGKTPIFCCVMMGAFCFMSDLMKGIESDIICDYVQPAKGPDGALILEKDLSHDASGRTIVLIEDIVDTGETLSFLLRHFESKYHPKRVIAVTLIDKTAHRKEKVRLDYVGKRIEDDVYLIGYGINYRGYVRYVPYVYVPEEEETRRWDEEIARGEGNR